MVSEILSIHNRLKNKEITCESLVSERLVQLEANAENSANSLLQALAIEKAKVVDKKIAAGEEIGLLEGIPFGLKDVYLLKGSKSTASSDMLQEYTSPYTATAIQKLLDAGAIPVVKENCDSFGHGSSSENTVFGAVKNAVDSERVAGGSSGGSAVNVAKGYTTFSIGGDTGGSIRQPAGFNKIYGLKPTYGRISRFGLMAYASSTDCVGPMATSLEDVRLLLNAMAGKDFRDQTSFDAPEVPAEALEGAKASEFKVGYYKSFIDSEALDPQIKSDFLALVEKLKGQGIEVKELDFFDADTLVATYYMIAMAETASNLARLDGSMYGGRIEAESLKDSYSVTRSENFTAETKRRIVGGNQVLSQGHSEAIYLKARALRNQIIQKFDEEFQDVNIILSPVSPNLPPKIGEVLDDPLAMYLSDAYTVGFSLGGLPTLTAPSFLASGLQITAAKAKEETILRFASYLEGLQ